MFKKLTWVIGAAWSLFLVGCGNPLNNQPIYGPASSLDYYSPMTAPSTTPNSSYKCSGSSTIQPQVNNLATTAGNYMICPSINSGNYSDILVHGTTINSNTICVFPAQLNSGGQVSWIRSTTDNSPIYQCIQTTTDGAYFSFPTTTGLSSGFNAAFIVEAPYQNAMKVCLQSNYAASACPAYSFGSFR